MTFENSPLPYDWVEIVNITQKDGSPLEPDNWRNENIGIVTICWIAGGLTSPTPFFKTRSRMVGGEIVDMELDWHGHASSGHCRPVETEPGIFEFTTSTSIYRFRVLSGEEAKNAQDALMQGVQELAATAMMVLGYGDSPMDGPVS